MNLTQQDDDPMLAEHNLLNSFAVSPSNEPSRYTYVVVNTDACIKNFQFILQELEDSMDKKIYLPRTVLRELRDTSMHSGSYYQQAQQVLDEIERLFLEGDQRIKGQSLCEYDGSKKMFPSTTGDTILQSCLYLMQSGKLVNILTLDQVMKIESMINSIPLSPLIEELKKMNGKLIFSFTFLENSKFFKKKIALQTILFSIHHLFQHQASRTYLVLM